MPAIGVRAAARISLEVGGASTCAASGHLAAYAGPDPARLLFRQSSPRRMPTRRPSTKLSCQEWAMVCRACNPAAMAG